MAHRYYDKKEIRYDDLYMVYSEKWIFIRFNPAPVGKSKKKIDKEVERIKKENR